MEIAKLFTERTAAEQSNETQELRDQISSLTEQYFLLGALNYLPVLCAKDANKQDTC